MFLTSHCSLELMYSSNIVMESLKKMDLSFFLCPAFCPFRLREGFFLFLIFLFSFLLSNSLSDVLQDNFRLAQIRVS